MADRAKIEALIARVEKLGGPDREVDARVASVDGLNFGWCGDDGWSCGKRGCPGCGDPIGLSDGRHSYPQDWRDDEHLPRYTASLDAVIALAERVLSGSNGGWAIGYDPDAKQKYHARFFCAELVPHSHAPTAPVALLLALLRALAANGDAE